MGQILLQINEFVWGVPALAAILGVGLFLSIRTGFAQLRLLPNGLRLFFKRMTQKDSKQSGISPYQAFCTALGATVGTGNIAGVAGAIAIGGPGAVFWMWISALLGMITKYAEALLAVRYQVMNNEGQMHAGPMYIIKSRMNPKWHSMAYIYAFLGVVASFGVGNSVQINAVISSIQSVLSTFGGKLYSSWILFMGLLSAILVYFLLIGGAKRVACTAEKLVPVVSIGYILLCMSVLMARWQVIDDALNMIIRGAFSPQAVTGGAVGSMLKTVKIGTSRGVFTNEAGLGTAGIAHGAAKVGHPAMQGVLGIVEVFLDTIVICTLTALVILCTGIPIDYGRDVGSELTINGFVSVFGEWITIPLSIITICLAIATVLGWGLYGARCAQFLFGEQSWKTYAGFHALAAFCGAVLQTPTIWLWAETMNGLMLLPNLLIIAHSSGTIISLTNEYKRMLKSERMLHCYQNTILSLSHSVRHDM